MFARPSAWLGGSLLGLPKPMVQPSAGTDTVTGGMLGTGSSHALAQERAGTAARINATATSTSSPGSRHGCLLLKMSLDSGT